MTEYMRNSGVEKLGRLVFESENYDEMNGTEKQTSRWIAGCTFNNGCSCYLCRDGETMSEYWNSVNNG